MKVNGPDSGVRGEDRRPERNVHAGLRQQGPRGARFEWGARPNSPSAAEGGSHGRGGTGAPPTPHCQELINTVQKTSSRHTPTGPLPRPPPPCKREEAPRARLAVGRRTRPHPAPGLSRLGRRPRAPRRPERRMWVAGRGTQQTAPHFLPLLETPRAFVCTLAHGHQSPP